ncbi:hypothetical protein [Thermoflavimicrobium dichotomicum]|uniref:Uncharacterized protein n=1 Tax=Thermoflavimicrobium dichotomicum TaxID=46223 RepID=A0A1I3TBX2_9BACL|nr:hypothetical protein [Thermoflavimicrobium dichotomicum]SFJ67156.1 hypothetical protein SAMN05421852_11654 [Thermoflavimicrobium dichotomicum]
MSYQRSFHRRITSGQSIIINESSPIQVPPNGQITFQLFDSFPTKIQLEISLCQFHSQYIYIFHRSHVYTPGETVRFNDLPGGEYYIMATNLGNSNISFMCHISNKKPYTVPNSSPVKALQNVHVTARNTGNVWVNGLTALQVQQGTIEVSIVKAYQYPYQVRIYAYTIADENWLYCDLTSANRLNMAIFSNLAPGYYDVSITSLNTNGFDGIIDIIAY